MAAAPASSNLVASVRMYRAILGDCFLLTLEQGEARTTILIDCGVLQGVTGARERMKAVADDIVRHCGGDPDSNVPGKLDLAVVTHEHADHISGFGHGHELLLNKDRLAIGELWMAWTEKEGDEQADRLRERFEKRKLAVTLAAQTASAGAPGRRLAAAPGWADLSVAQFIGEIDFGDDLAVAGTGETTRGPRTGRQIMQRLKEVAGTTRYFEPGTVTATPGGVNLRTYVLGPPRDEERLFHDLPSKGAAKETYFAVRSLTEEAMIHFSSPDDPDNPEAELHRSSPFARPHWALPASRVEGAAGLDEAGLDEADRAAALLHARYFAKETHCRYAVSPPRAHDCDDDPVCRAPQEHRRIDGDWLAGAGAVALKLDSDTNNTSLVLAFELPDKGILLFAADAQVGNWLSWHDQDYEADGEAVTALDLLSRTILYKVGHHCSHNATLREQGLEAMTDPRLVAMIPVVEEVARKQGRKGWNMPFPELKHALLERTKGRLLRGDAPKGRDADGSVLTEDEDFLERVTEGPDGLWLEYRVTL